MSKTYCVVASLFLLAFSAGCSNDVNSSSDFNKRTAIKTEWLKSTKEVVQKINDKEVTEVFHFLETNAILAAPHEKGLQFAEEGKSDKWIAILPMLEKDKEVSKYWKGMYEVNSASNFLPEPKTLVIKDYIPYSPQVKAIVMLHEGLHAYIFMSNPYEGEQSDKDYCFEEVKAHMFQNRVMRLLGGKRYQDVLNKEVARITATAKIGTEEFSVPDVEYIDELKTVFGKPASKGEEDFIQSSVWLNAVFVVLDNHFKKDAEEQKAFFLRSLYKKDGII